MTTPAFPVFLGLIVIDETNNAIRMKEGSSTIVVEIATGVYFLRGNGTDTDFCAAFADALNSHTNATNANTYDVTVTFDRSPANPSATVTITRATGSSTFQLLLSHADTTFDPALIGFAEEDTSDDGSDKVSTLSPSCVWVGNAIFSSLEPTPSHERDIKRSRGGVIRAVDRASFRDRYWVQRHIEARRFHEEEIEDDEARALSKFLARHADGKRFEFHGVDVETGTTLEALASATKIATFVFTNDFYPSGRRLGLRESGVPLYSLEGLLWKVRDDLELDEFDGVPVQSSLTHWSEADDDEVLSSTSGYFLLRDKGPYAYADSPDSAGGAAENVTTAFLVNGDPAVQFEAAALNGKRGLRAVSGSFQAVAEEWALDTAQRNTIRQTHGYNSATGAFTVQWLVKHNGTAGLLLRLVNAGGVFDSIELYSSGGGAASLYRASVGHDTLGTIFDGAAHLLTFRCAGYGQTIETFLDDDFSASLTAHMNVAAYGASDRAPTINGPGGGTPANNPLHFGLLVYNEALTEEQLQANYDYFVARWGAL